MKLPTALTRPNEMSRMVVSYTALRLALFAIPFFGLLLTPLPAILDVAIALVISAVASYPLGRYQRGRMVVLLEERKARKSSVR